MANLWGWATNVMGTVTRGLNSRWWGGGTGRDRTPDLAYDYGRLPGSRIDFEAEAGPLELNSAVAACLGWMSDEWAKAEFQVQRTRRDGTVEPVYGHELLEQIHQPTEFDSGQDLWCATLKDYICDGNAYWLKVRGGLGEVVELWHVPSWRVEPTWSLNGTEWIGAYHIEIDGVCYAVAPSEVVHFRDGKDLYNERKGCSRLKAGLRSICGLNQAETITYLLTHSPIPGMVVSKQMPASASVDELPDIGAATARRLKAMAESRTTKDSRYRVVVVETGVKVDQAGWSPEQLALDRLPILPESTVCALMGVAPQVVGLRSAAEHAAYATAEVAVRRSWSRLQAVQNRFAATVTRRLLLDDFETSAKFRCGWDYAGVEALGEQSTEKAARASLLFEKKLITRNESREIVGLDSLEPEWGDVFADGSGPGQVEPEEDPPVTLPGGGGGDDDDEEKEDDDDMPPATRSRQLGFVPRNGADH